MAHAPACCPSARGSGDGEIGKPRKVALITGITGQDQRYQWSKPKGPKDVAASLPLQIFNGTFVKLNKASINMLIIVEPSIA
ncbi:GDP-mannose 4,6 dehydratase [Tupaia chinensis]|uniref:GDP-mannose 4,6 dehydratase n=1 Tax=Tupaia chinensis TaxID=246437 RepID=L9L6Q8_TUPCH|nr:GDP-mannose 4,6 dehydratase [Tupaia chinensis]